MGIIKPLVGILTYKFRSLTIVSLYKTIIRNIIFIGVVLKIRLLFGFLDIL